MTDYVLYSIYSLIVLFELPQRVVAVSKIVYWTSLGTRNDTLVIVVFVSRTTPPLLFDMTSVYSCTSAHELS